MNSIGIAIKGKNIRKGTLFSLLEEGNAAVFGNMIHLSSISTSQELRAALEGAVIFENDRNELSGTLFEKGAKKRLTELPTDEETLAFITKGREKSFHLTHLVAMYGDIYELIDFLSYLQTIDSVEDIESVIITVNHNRPESEYEWVVFSRDKSPVRYSYIDHEAAFSLSVFKKIVDGKLKGTITSVGDLTDEKPQMESPEMEAGEDKQENETTGDSLFQDDLAGEVYFLEGGNVYKAFIMVRLGTGQVFNYGFKAHKDVLEYVKDAYFQFREANTTVSDKIDCRAYDYSIRYECLTGRQVTTELSLPTFIGLCSANLQKPVKRNLLTVLDGDVDNMMMEFLERIIPGGVKYFLLSKQSSVSVRGGYKAYFYESWPDAVKIALSDSLMDEIS